MNRFFKKISIAAAVILFMAAGVFVLVESGLFTAEPKVEAAADNCYEETLHVITDEDYRPYSFYGKDGTYSGHDVELIRLLANEMHMNLDLRLMNWADGIAAVGAGEADVLMTCDYSDSFEGTENLIKTEPVSFDEFVVYSMTPVSSPDVLYGKRVAVMKNGNAMFEIVKYRLNPYIIEYPDNRAAMQALISGEADCAIMRGAVGTVLLQELNNYSVRACLALGSSDMCFGVDPAQPGLSDRINTALEALKVRGELEKLREKWLTTFIKPYTVQEILARYPWIILTFIGLAILLIAGFVRNRLRELKDEETEYRNSQIIEQLAQDFECVDYITLTGSSEHDPLINYRVSENLNRLIPGWAKERFFRGKLRLLCDNLVYEPDREQFWNDLTDGKILAAFGESGVFFENVRLFYDDSVHYYQMKFSPVYEGNRLKNIVAGLHSVDAQTRREMAMQEQLQNALAEADAANRSKTEFLFNMSHDIRTPMNAILGYTDMGLRHAADAERAAESFRKIKSSGKHLLELINDILEMSRIESGKMILCEDPIDLREAVDGVDTMCRALAVPKSIDFQTVAGEIRDPYILSDELHINEILINLISNAVKYTPDGGKVRFSVSQISEPRDGAALYRFEVSDNGIGMSEAFQKHLFESFAREEISSVSRTEGAGLGLSIVKKILDIAGGTIRVRSVQGEGSVFTVEMPFRLMDEASIEKFRKLRTAQPLSEMADDLILEGKRILLVEDNDINREIANDILSEAGVQVENAEDGAVALRMMTEKGPAYYDCVLMDIQMPVMNGYEATRAIRSLYPDAVLPIIALSANAFAEDRQAALEAGMNDHIAKPIEIPRLKETIRKYL